MRGHLLPRAPVSRAVFPCLHLLFLGALAAGCGGDKEDSAGQDRPDIAGSYNVIVSGTSGCSGVDDWITGWVGNPNGALTIAGDPAALTFSFGADVDLAGSASADYLFAFSGEPVYNDADLTVYGSGSITSETSTSGGAQWVLKGEVEAEVDDDEFDDNNCTITGVFEAFQLIGA